MSNKLKTGIIGLGKVAGIHAAALTSIPKSAFTAVCGRVEKRTLEFASRYGVKAVSYTHLTLPTNREV